MEYLIFSSLSLFGKHFLDTFTVFKCKENRYAKHKQNGNFPDCNQSALYEKIYEIQTVLIHKEKVYFKTDYDTIHQSRHEQGEKRYFEEFHFPECIHG